MPLVFSPIVGGALCCFSDAEFWAGAMAANIKNARDVIKARFIYVSSKGRTSLYQNWAQRMRTSQTSSAVNRSKQEITLRQWQDARRFAGNQLTIHADLVSFRVDVDLRRRGVMNHVLLCDHAAIPHRSNDFLEPEARRQPGGKRLLRQERDAGGGGGSAERSEHRPVNRGLGSGN